MANDRVKRAVCIVCHSSGYSIRIVNGLDFFRIFSVQIDWHREWSVVKQSAVKQSSSDEDDRYEAFVRLLVEHEPRVRSFLRGLLPSWHDVEEVAQEASLIAWRKFDSFEEGTAFGGWLLTIARFEALKYRRRVARSPLVFSDEVWELLAEEASGEENLQIRRRHLEVCLGKMELTKRNLLLKVHTSGVVIREVAQESGKGEEAFYKVIQRLRVSLRDCVLKSIETEKT